ncbi:MAG TPA: zinc ABC transporter substrate-binding protein [Bacteroidia bacterium]|nr:zinc ABC transporter substrate-binding protein [Bacteroidia bacterium]HNT80449.1 zinc ABC transporter substrate-binding protein [Bacteroidia bacterium]
MNRILKYIAFILMMALGACTDPVSKDTSSKLKIVCTTGMIEDAIKNICDTLVDVTSLMGPGIDPHLYKPSLDDLNLIRSADIVVYNGLHLEGKMVDIFEKMSNQKPTLAMVEDNSKHSLILADSVHGVHDPHVWFDVELWSHLIIDLGDHLGKIDTRNALIFKDNAKAYATSLRELHSETAQRISEIPKEQRILITAHDAFEYFGRAYDVRVEGLQGISTLAEFGLKDITTLVNHVTENKIKAIFVESSVPKKSIEAVIEGCKAKGHNVIIGGTLYSDAMGDKGTNEGTYKGMVQHNVSTIVNALK